MKQPDNPFWPRKSILHPAPVRESYIPVRRIKKTLNREEQRIVDVIAEDRFRIPKILLMEHAGLAVTEICEYMAGSQTTPVHIFTGKGNNGGDAYVSARLLFGRGFSVTVWDCFPEYTHAGLVKNMKDAVIALGIPVRPADAFDPQILQSGISHMLDERVSGMPCVIIDGIIGTGFEYIRSLPTRVRNITMRMEEAHIRGARVLAIDIPTGVDADTGEADLRAVAADCTVTFILPKPGILQGRGKELAGQIRVFPIGLPIDFADRILRP
jgi:hydroxyethylthiazole kinase-like uncharacterized protein yjeF